MSEEVKEKAAGKSAHRRKKGKKVSVRARVRLLPNGASLGSGASLDVPVEGLWRRGRGLSPQSWPVVHSGSLACG